jgi:Protein of unknown function (DUF1222).
MFVDCCSYMMLHDLFLWLFFVMEENILIVLFLLLYCTVKLDWQMWFAALGSYQHNPWFIHLIHKLLQGCGPVIELLDEPLLAKGDEKLVSVESLLYHYDFSSPLATNNTKYCNGDDQQHDGGRTSAGDWWVRSGPIREYVPKVVRDDPSLLQYLKAYGYRANMCLTSNDRCKLLQPGSKSMTICRMVAAIRNFT